MQQRHLWPNMLATMMLPRFRRPAMILSVVPSLTMIAMGTMHGQPSCSLLFSTDGQSLLSLKPDFLCHPTAGMGACDAYDQSYSGIGAQGCQHTEVYSKII